MDDPKWKFVHSQILTGCVATSFQHAKVYAVGVTDNQRDQLHAELGRALSEIGASYNQDVSEPKHLENIVELSRRISKCCGTALAGGRLRVGIAQKALNLYLKYLWCLDRIQRPPHCPFDSRVIAKLPKCSSVRWTQIDDLDDYKALVESAKKQAGANSLADWELQVWNAVGNL